MSWRRKPQPTKAIRIGNRGILTMPESLDLDEVQRVARQFDEALRGHQHLIVASQGIEYTPLPARKRIRLAAAERWLTA